MELMLDVCVLLRVGTEHSLETEYSYDAAMYGVLLTDGVVEVTSSGTRGSQPCRLHVVPGGTYPVRPRV
jgi:hypothetical protein